MNKQIFRKISIDRLSSPEQLDNLLQVTSSRGWLALLGIVLLLIVLVLWSIFGRIPTKLNGQQCILVKSGGVNVLTSVTQGRLVDLSIERGDTVTRGQIIGRIDQSDMLQKIKSTEARLKEVQAQYEQVQKIARQSSDLRSNSMNQQIQSLRSQLASNERKLKLLKERLDSQNTLLQQGLITKQAVIGTEMEMSATQLEKDNLHAQFKQLELQQLEDKKRSENEVVQAKNQLEDVMRSLDLSLREAKNSTLITSPYSGKVLEVKVSEGQLVDRGTQLVSVEASGSNINEIEAYVYLPAADGKKVKPGMRVEISPSTVKREEFGFLPAYISTVADYPSTDQGLMRIFGNEHVVKQLTGTNAPIQIVASLKPSATNPSNYEWSTRAGPPFAIQSGTLCAAGITISEQRPLSLVLPVLKKLSGIE